MSNRMEKEAVRMEKETILMEKETVRMGGICRLLKNLVKNYFLNQEITVPVWKKGTACQD